MAIENPQKALVTARFWQPLVCLSLLASIGLSALVLEAAVHSEPLGVWMDRNWAIASNTPNMYNRQFLDTEDRVVLEDVANLDPTAGGVYFFGSSSMKWAMCRHPTCRRSNAGSSIISGQGTAPPISTSSSPITW